MSDNYVHIIPVQPGLVPDQERQQEAVLYFRSIAPTASEVSASTSDDLRFIHCGGNFERICCPFCKATIEVPLWHKWMNADYGAKGFTLTQHIMPCCATTHTLQELVYEWPQGFARWDLQAMNPEIGKLSDEHRGRFEEILGCPVRIIYERM
jgi:hypothetical protein